MRLVQVIAGVVLLSTASFSAIADKDAEKKLRGKECRSVFVSISTERPTGQEVGLLASNANLSVIGALVDIFLADGAAYLVLSPEYWDPAQYDQNDPQLLALQEQLKGLVDGGANAFGCPPCVQRALDPASGVTLFIPNPDPGPPEFILDEEAWNSVVFEEGKVEPISPELFSRIYDRRVRSEDCTRIEQSTLSF